MGLPKRLDQLVMKIATGSEMAERLLATRVKRLSRNLETLIRVAGAEGASQYDRLIQCAFEERSAACFDQFEEAIEHHLTLSWRRELSEQEEVLVGLLLDEISSSTEALLILGGLELIEEPDEEESEGQSSP